MLIECFFKIAVSIITKSFTGFIFTICSYQKKIDKFNFAISYYQEKTDSLQKQKTFKFNFKTLEQNWKNKFC